MILSLTSVGDQRPETPRVSNTLSATKVREAHRYG